MSLVVGETSHGADDVAVAAVFAASLHFPHLIENVVVRRVHPQFSEKHAAPHDSALDQPDDPPPISLLAYDLAFVGRKIASQRQACVHYWATLAHGRRRQQAQLLAGGGVDLDFGDMPPSHCLDRLSTFLVTSSHVSKPEGCFRCPAWTKILSVVLCQGPRSRFCDVRHQSRRWPRTPFPRWGRW
jgi:hypothetical protein